METPSRCPAGGGGLWSSARAADSSRESRERLTLMKQESRLANLQRKQINQNSKKPPPPPPPSPLTRTSYVSQRRSAESCRSGRSYEREKFRPGPTRDLEKEKRRLQNIFSTGGEEEEEEEEATDALPPNAPAGSERDRYEEVLDEIEERRQFLADMAALGQERKYMDIINAEISQKKRELDMLETRRVKAAATVTAGTDD